MPKVWTRNRAGTGPATPPVASRTSHRVVRNPVSDFPKIHQIELPLPRSSEERQPESVQAYLIEGEPLTLIDAGVGTEQCLDAFGAAMEGLGFSISDIERVVVTHSHHDHFGLVEALRAAGAQLECWVHEDDADLVEDFPATAGARVGSMTELLREFGVPDALRERLHEEARRALEGFATEASRTVVDRRLRGGDRIEWKDYSLAVLHSPGHTPGHILLEDEDRGLLFSGDQIMSGAIPNAEHFLTDEGGAFTDEIGRRPHFRGLVEMRRSLRRLRGRPYKLLLPGYGPSSRRADRLIRDTLLYYEVRLQRIDRGLRHLAGIGQDVTAFEIAQALFPGASSTRETRSHLQLVIGALDCLEEDGLLRAERRADGVVTYSHR